MPFVGEGDADRQGVAERDVDRPADADVGVAAAAGLHAAVDAVERRPGGDDVDRAHGGVAAPQGALRAAQHFDGVQIKQQRRRAFGPGRIDPVDEHGDFGIGVFGLGAVVADAPQRHGHNAMVAFRRGLEVRDQVGDVLDGVDVLLVQRRAVNRRDGQRSLLQWCAALGGGDEDFVRRSGCRPARGRRCGGVNSGEQRYGCCRRAERQPLAHLWPLP